MKYPKLKENEVLVLKRCIQDSKSSNDFIYPKNGMVEAPDWKATDACGHGLHGWTYGFDSYFDGKLNGNFIVILVNKNDGYIELVDKVKFRKGRVLLNTPDAQEAHSFMSHYYPKMALHWATQTAKYSSIQKTGNYSTQTAGYQSTQTAGYCSTQTAGSESTQKAGYSSTQTAGHWSTQKAGYSSTQTAGSYSFINNYVRRDCFNIVKPAKCSIVSSINITEDRAKSFVSNTDNTTYVINSMCEIEKVYTCTPDNIKKLKEYEIFVFGSNLNGNHAGGAAKLASERFDAEDGIGEGLTGQSYAFPTLDKDMNKVSVDALKESVKKLYKCANENTGKVFLLTKVGCGIAGFSEQEIAALFIDAPVNIIKPKGW